jgi:hypothetical protein
MNNLRPQKRKRPNFLMGNSRRKCCERPVSYTPLPRSVCGYHRPAYGHPRNEQNLAISALVGMARFFFVVIVAGTIVLIGAFVFVAFTL